MGARDFRYWRTFPSGIQEFPKVFRTNLEALAYLKERYEIMASLPPVERVKPRSAASSLWEEWLGRNPFEDSS